MSIFENEFNLDEMIVGRSEPTFPAPANQRNIKEIKKDRWFNSHDGFFCLPRSIREDQTLTNAEFRVLVTLASFVFLHDQATPSLETLKKYTDMAEGTISKATTSLEKKGWLTKEQRPYNSVLYRFTLPDRYKKGNINKSKQTELELENNK